MSKTKIREEKFLDLKSGQEILQEAVDLSHRDFSRRKIMDFINKYIYLGTGHFVIVETLAKSGFKKTAKIYLKTFMDEFLEDKNKEELTVPETIDYDNGYGTAYEEWVKRVGI